MNVVYMSFFINAKQFYFIKGIHLINILNIKKSFEQVVLHIDDYK